MKPRLSDPEFGPLLETAIRDEGCRVVILSPANELSDATLWHPSERAYRKILRVCLRDSARRAKADLPP